MEVLRKLDVPSVKQVIAVPEISWDWVPQRQLVEVPTERGYVFSIIAAKALGWREAAALAEQLVATPVPQGRRGGCGSLQDSRAGRGSSAAVVKQIVDTRVPHGRRGVRGGLQGLRPGQNSTAADVERIVDIPARGGLQGFLPGQGSSSSSRLFEDTDDGIQGFFSNFPPAQKSAESTRQSSPRVLASASSSELSAHQMALARESDEPGGALDDAIAD